ncbi:MAG: heptose kinase [Porticoccus sp.]|nr:MAG: heptose kinase [Porticoccus sp.]
MSCWFVDRAILSEAAAERFSSLDSVFATTGRRVTRCPISELILTEIGEKSYYVKRYSRRGKVIRRWLGRSRVRAEWENLLFFRGLGLRVPPIAAYGESGARGVLITEEVPGAIDLHSLVRQRPELLRDRNWLDQVVVQVADVAKQLHANSFAHNDLKWRNILVAGEVTPEVYLIDCPMGQTWWGPLLAYKKIKDIACLDKVAKYCLNRTVRLRFYLHYVGRDRLTAADKTFIRKVLAFFAGRE